MKTEPNDPAMPVVIDHDRTWHFSTGLSKREHFAALAMAAMIGNSAIDIMKPEEYAADSLMHADALIEALNRESA